MVVTGLDNVVSVVDVPSELVIGGRAVVTPPVVI